MKPKCIKHTAIKIVSDLAISERSAVRLHDPVYVFICSDYKSKVQYIFNHLSVFCDKNSSDCVEQPRIDIQFHFSMAIG